MFCSRDFLLVMSFICRTHLFFCSPDAGHIVEKISSFYSRYNGINVASREHCLKRACFKYIFHMNKRASLRTRSFISSSRCSG